ncbi:YugN-like family protein [Paenibacillus sp. J5C_2022]|uniref:YugN-like family protein n=1 Tax=Paenibacillus sp. J5C2022 TaxID=2977129 RepID=UPI0021D0FF1E|nr:YugN-like family protein [Paenibacillus sp. J5C2022]MCU6708975.1 YugN-like family protein [Paenibacillus sp. J5C2022]
MIIENSGLIGLQSELHHLDDAADKVGFVRWQWEYYRATYDLKLTDRTTSSDYFLRLNTRAVEGKLESAHAVLNIEAVYIGRATFPHGLDYESPIPKHILEAAEQKLQQLKSLLA